MMSATVQFRRACLFLAISLVVATLRPSAGQAQVAKVEVDPLSSVTLTDQEFLTGKKDGKPVIIAGELRIPKPGTDRLPAVLLIHGSGGVSGFVDAWSQFVNGVGVATFVLDGFMGRGLVSTVNDQSQLGRLAMIVDAYHALDLLAKHPRIDPDRIAVMGFSRGGQAALYASSKRFQRMHGPTAGQQFGAYIAFYPDCMTNYRADDDVADMPIRTSHGSADDYNPVSPCRSYVEKLRRKGMDVQLTEYPDAYHLFDWPTLKTPVKLAQAQTTRRCHLEEAADGQIINSQTRHTFTYSDRCVEYGPTLAYNAQAHSEAQKAVRELVAAVLKPN